VEKQYYRQKYYGRGKSVPMRSRKSLSEFILLALERSVDGYVRLGDFANNSHIYARGYDRPLKKSALSQAIKRLRKRGLIDFIDDKNWHFN
jgi:hypothetical protein